MSGNGISVYCRFRPHVKKSKNRKEPFQFLDTKTVQVASGVEFDQGVQYKFDKVFTGATTQQEVYDEMGSSIIDQTLEGFNCCLMAYGMTSSGKSHSLYGSLSNNDQWGVIPRLSKELFERLESRVEQDMNFEYTVNVSMVELYLEKIHDLLRPKSDKNVAIHERMSDDLGRKEVYIKGCKKVMCSDVSDIIKQLKKGEKNRTIGSTDMNKKSSRSHSLCIVEVVQHNSTTGFHIRSKLMLADLAGSESVRNTHAQGLELKQAQSINKSLTLLAHVIKKLSENRSEHIPYRDSKLTRLLSEALGGNNQTHMLLTCSSEQDYARESIFTMRFGLQAQSIKNAPLVNTIYTLEDYKSMVEQKDQIIQQQSMLIQALESAEHTVENKSSRHPSLQIDTHALTDLANVMNDADDDEVTSKSPLTGKSVRFGKNTLHPIMDQEDSEVSEAEDGDEVTHMTHRSMSHDFRQKGNHVLIVPKRSHSRSISAVSNVSVPYTPVSRAELLLQTEVVMRLQEDLEESECKVFKLEEDINERNDLLLETEAALAFSKEKVLKHMNEIEKLQNTIHEIGSIEPVKEERDSIDDNIVDGSTILKTSSGSGNKVAFYIGWVFLWIGVLICYGFIYFHKPMWWHSGAGLIFTVASILVLLSFENII